VTIPVESEVAQVLANPVRREAVEGVPRKLIKDEQVRDVLADAIADVKREAPANGLTVADIDAELADWRSERQA
jgi:hypothetical protein